MDVVTVLPLAFVMVAGPQIISAVFFATSESWKSASAAYVLGAAISITLVVTAAYLLANVIGGDDGDGDAGLNAVDYAILALLLFAMVNAYRKRKVTEPPKWMGRLQSATPRFSFLLGFLLLGFFPSDLVTSVTVGSRLGNEGDPWWNVFPFVLLTLLLLSAPALIVATLGPRGEEILPRVRDWMNVNSWIISEGVLAFFVVIVLTG